jgi:hypothetical protein
MADGQLRDHFELSATAVAHTLTRDAKQPHSYTATWDLKTGEGSVPDFGGEILFRLVPNRAPQSVALSNSAIPEQSAADTIVGTLSAVDPDGDAVTFTLADDAGGAFRLVGNELRVADASLAGEAAQYPIIVRATDSLGLSTSQPFQITVTPLPPALMAITVGDGGAQRSQVTRLTLSFDKRVGLAGGAVSLSRLNTGGSGANDDSPPTDASAALSAPTTDDDGLTWVYTFIADSAFVQQASGGTSTGSLVDGIYKVDVDPTKVTAGDVAMTTGGSLTFHRLFGDFNGTKGVNAADYNAFRGAFGKGSADPAYNAAFDFDGNGSINAADYNQFRSRFGKSLSY